MKLSELERIVLKLANQLHVRYWKHWNHPETEPWLMAIQFLNFGKEAETLKLFEELKQLGFKEKLLGGRSRYWIIERDRDEVKHLKS